MNYHETKHVIYGIIRQELNKEPADRIAALAGETATGISRVETAFRRFLRNHEYNIRMARNPNAQPWDFKQAGTLIDPSYMTKRARINGIRQAQRLAWLHTQGFETFVGVCNLPAPKTFFWRNDCIKKMADVIRFDRSVNKAFMGALKEFAGKGQLYICRQEEITFGCTPFVIRAAGAAGARLNFHTNLSISIAGGLIPEGVTDVDQWFSDLIWSMLTRIVCDLKAANKEVDWIFGDCPLAKPDVASGTGPFRFSKITAEDDEEYAAKLTGWTKDYALHHKKLGHGGDKAENIEGAIGEVVGGLWKVGDFGKKRADKRIKSYTPFQIPAKYHRQRTVKGALAKAWLLYCWFAHSGRTHENSRGIKFPLGIGSGPAKRERQKRVFAPLQGHAI